MRREGWPHASTDIGAMKGRFLLSLFSPPRVAEVGIVLLLIQEEGKSRRPLDPRPEIPEKKRGCQEWLV